jgi:hypothetical protein
MLHGLHVLTRSLGSVVVGIFEFPSVEELRSRIGICPSSTRTDLLDQLGINLAITDCLHHGKVLKIVMRLE